MTKDLPFLLTVKPWIEIGIYWHTKNAYLLINIVAVESHLILGDLERRDLLRVEE